MYKTNALNEERFTPTGPDYWECPFCLSVQDGSPIDECRNQACETHLTAKEILEKRENDGVIASNRDAESTRRKRLYQAIWGRTKGE